MKDSIKTWVVVLVFAAVMLTMGFIAGRCLAPEQETVIDTVTDTITDWKYDTVFRVDTKVVKLPVHDTTTVTDSLWLTDSVLVEVPMMRYRYDTTLADTHSTTREPFKMGQMPPLEVQGQGILLCQIKIGSPRRCTCPP